MDSSYKLIGKMFTRFVGTPPRPANPSWLEERSFHLFSWWCDAHEGWTLSCSVQVDIAIFACPLQRASLCPTRFFATHNQRCLEIGRRLDAGSLRCIQWARSLIGDFGMFCTARHPHHDMCTSSCLTSSQIPLIKRPPDQSLEKPSAE